MKKRWKTDKKRDRLKLIPVIAAVLILCFTGVLMLLIRNHRRETYPRLYEEEVLAASESYGLDPNLVFAVIRTESGFSPNAVSSAGAKGLMQIMQTTGEWVCWRQGTEYDASRIFEPEYNIDIGCHLLRYLIDRYDGELRFAIAAYNAGAGAVDSWLKDPEKFDGEELTIPYPETKNYVKKVLDSYEKYKETENKN